MALDSSREGIASELFLTLCAYTDTNPRESSVMTSFLAETSELFATDPTAAHARVQTLCQSLTSDPRGFALGLVARLSAATPATQPAELNAISAQLLSACRITCARAGLPNPLSDPKSAASQLSEALAGELVDHQTLATLAGQVGDALVAADATQVPDSDVSHFVSECVTEMSHLGQSFVCEVSHISAETMPAAMQAIARIRERSAVVAQLAVSIASRSQDVSSALQDEVMRLLDNLEKLVIGLTRIAEQFRRRCGR
jgi:hypothetical protein